MCIRDGLTETVFVDDTLSFRDTFVIILGHLLEEFMLREAVRIVTTLIEDVFPFIRWIIPRWLKDWVTVHFIDSLFVIVRWVAWLSDRDRNSS